MKLMLFLLSFAGCVFLNAQGSGDPFLEYLGKSDFDCEHINERNLKLWPALIAENKEDSALAVFQTWDAACPNFYVLSLKTLYSIEFDSLASIQDLLYDLEFIAWYSNRHQLPYTNDKGVRKTSASALYLYRNGQSREESAFWNALKTKALQVAQTKNEGTFSYNMALFLAHREKPLFKSLQKADFVTTPTVLIQNYTEMKKARAREFRGEGALFLSTWIPQGNIEALGIHPGVGLQAGVSENYWRATGSITVHFLPAPQTYKVLQADTLVTTERFVHFSFLANGSRVLLRNERHELSVGIGVGYSGIEAVANSLPDEDEESNAVILSSVDASVGFEYRFYYRRSAYVGLGASYHVNDFKNNINNTLSGNTIGVRLLFGISQGNEDYSLNAFGLR